VSEISQPQDLFFTRLMATRALHASFHAWCAAQLATMKLKPGFRLVLDGCNALGVARELKASGGRLQFSNVLLDESNDLLELERKRLSFPVRMLVTAHEDQNHVFVCDSACVGEGDLKIPWHISQQPAGESIHVRCCDSDVLVILLLHIKNYIDTKAERGGRNVRYKISLDTNSRSTGEQTPILDVVQLWEDIMKHFRSNFACVPASSIMESFAMLILFSGSDYVRRLPQFGAKGVWNTFSLSGSPSTSILFPRHNPLEPAVVLDDVAAGQPFARVNARLHEDHIFRFFVLIYFRKVFRNAPFPFEENPLNPETSSVFLLAKAREARYRVLAAKGSAVLNSQNGHHWQVPTDNDLRVVIRNIHWNIDYLLNGSKIKSGAFLDPFVVHGQSKLSLHGWSRDDHGGAARATEIHH